MISAATGKGRRKCRSVGSVRRISTGFYVTHNNRRPKEKTLFPCVLPSSSRQVYKPPRRRDFDSLCSFRAFDILTGC